MNKVLYLLMAVGVVLIVLAVALTYRDKLASAELHEKLTIKHLEAQLDIERKETLKWQVEAAKLATLLYYRTNVSHCR